MFSNLRRIQSLFKKEPRKVQYISCTDLGKNEDKHSKLGGKSQEQGHVPRLSLIYFKTVWCWQ